MFCNYITPKEPLSTPESYTIKPAILKKYFGVINNTGKKVILTEVSTNISSGITFPNWKPITISPQGLQYFEVHFEFESIRKLIEAGAWYHIHIKYFVEGLNKSKSAYIPLNIDWLPTHYKSITIEDDFQEKMRLSESEIADSKMAKNDDQKVRMTTPILVAFLAILATFIIMDVFFH